MLRIHTASVEREVASEATFQFTRLHPGGTHLHRIEHVDAGLDEVGDDWQDGATGMVEDADGHLRLLPDESKEARVPRFDQTSVKLGAAEQSILAGQIVGLGNDHDIWANALQRPGPILHLDFADRIEQRLGKRHVRHHVAEEILETSHPKRDLKNAGGIAAQHVGDLTTVHEFIGPGPHAVVPAWIQRIGERITRKGFHGVDPVQRMPAHVVVKPAILWFPPFNPPFVLDLVIPVLLPGRPGGRVGLARVEPVNVDLESLFEIFVHAVELLNRILELERHGWQPEMLP